MKALTARQQEVYDLIRDHIEQTGMPPTRAEIAQRLGFRSPNAAEEHLKALQRKGVIEIVSGASRGIRLLMEDETGYLSLAGWLPVSRCWHRNILRAIIRSTLHCLSLMPISYCVLMECRCVISAF